MLNDFAGRINFPTKLTNRMGDEFAVDGITAIGLASAGYPAVQRD